MKKKKVLSIIAAISLVLQLFCTAAFAAKTTCADVGFDGGEWGDANNIQHYSLVSGIYGKDTSDYCAKAPNSDGNIERFFQVFANSSAAVPSGGKLKISVDLAANTFDANDHSEIPGRNTLGRYIRVKFGSAWKFIYQVNDVSFDNVLAMKNAVKPYQWNNITAVFDFNSDNTACDYTLYINGEKALEKNSFSVLGGKALTSVDEMRIGGIISAASDELYYDNIVVETYESGDSAPALDFVTGSGAASGNEALVDVDNKKINLEDAEMTVAEFKSKTNGFTVLDSEGNPVSDSDYIAASKVYAVYKNDTNMYYVPYEVSVEPPVITANEKGKYSAIIDNDAHTIRLVDYPNMTAREFIENTSGATVVKKDGSVITDDTLLKECRVSAVLGNIYDIEYTYIVQRRYAVENEGFDKCSERTSTGKLFENSGLTWVGHVQNSDNVTFKPVSGIGGKSADDKSAVLNVDNSTKNGTPMIYADGNPYYGGKEQDLKNTFTVESKLYISQMNEKVSSIQITLHGRKALLFERNGTIKSIDNSTTAGTWEMNKWIPIAFTYFKDTNEMYVYVNGAKVNMPWKAGIPFQPDIRFIANCSAGAVCEFAIDDFKLYSDSLEICKYNISDNAVTVTATESLNCVPILAKYDEETGRLLSIVPGTDSKSVTMNYSAGETVKAMLWESVTNSKPIIASKILVDRGNPVNAYSAVISKAFTNGMVLQSGMPVKIWGTSGDADGATLNVSLDGNTKTAYVNGGKWEVTLPAMEESSVGKNLTVATAAGEQTINDILIGDVYYIGGQSNAYFRMSGTDTFEADRASFTESDNIRFFHQEGTYSDTVCANPVSGSRWESATTATVGKLSAIGAYFAKTLRNNGVTAPIGLVQFAHNGTSLHYDIPNSITSKYTIDYLPERTNQSYNAMLAPVEKFAAKGLIWYQGENDSIESLINKSLANYPDMFKEFISYMKTATGSDSLKVFNVQLSSHSINDLNPAGTAPNATLGWNIPRFRAFQYDLTNSMEDVYIVPSLDHGFKNGDSDAAHPIYKKPIGERLADAALYAVYGKKTKAEALAPVVRNVSYNGDTVTIEFGNAGDGLRTADGKKLCGFEVIDGAGNAYAANATISGKDKVIVKSENVSAAKGVRYAFYQSAPRTIANLENSYSMPCLTFANDIGSEEGSISAAVKAISRGEMLNK